MNRLAFACILWAILRLVYGQDGFDDDFLGGIET